MHTASHCALSLKHPLRACGELGISTSQEPDFPSQSCHPEFLDTDTEGPEESHQREDAGNVSAAAVGLHVQVSDL